MPASDADNICEYCGAGFRSRRGQRFCGHSCFAKSTATPMRRKPFIVDPVEHVGLVASIGRKLLKRRVRCPIEDTWDYSCGVMGLIRACTEFNPDLRVKFSTYAWKAISREIIRRRQQHMASVLTQSQKLTTTFPIRSRPIDQLIRQEEKSWFRLAWKSANSQDRELIWSRVCDGDSFTVIGSRLGVSKTAARNRFVSAVERVRQIIPASLFC